MTLMKNQPSKWPAMKLSRSFSRPMYFFLAFSVITVTCAYFLFLLKCFFPYLNKYAKSFGFEKFTLFARAICHTNTFPDKNPSSTVKILGILLDKCNVFMFSSSSLKTVFKRFTQQKIEAIFLFSFKANRS